MSTTWIRVTYGVVLALVLLFTVQFGVALALPGPKPPEDPDITFRQLTAGDEESGQNRLTAGIDRYYGESKDYRDKYVDYQRNAFLAGAGLAALLAMIGLVLPAAVNYLRWGLLLGAGLVLAWVWYLATRQPPNPGPAANSVLALLAFGEPKQLDVAGRFLRFALSFVTLILLLFIGLWRLTEWPSTTRRTAVAGSTPASAPAVATAGPAPVAAGPSASTWGPPPTASTAPPVATESTTVISDAPPRSEQPPAAEGVRWQRPAEGGEPARAPDTTP